MGTLDDPISSFSFTLYLEAELETTLDTTVRPIFLTNFFTFVCFRSGPIYSDYQNVRKARWRGRQVICQTSFRSYSQDGSTSSTGATFLTIDVPCCLRTIISITQKDFLFKRHGNTVYVHLWLLGLLGRLLFSNEGSQTLKHRHFQILFANNFHGILYVMTISLH